MHTASVDIPNCVHEVVGAFLKLRNMSVAPGHVHTDPDERWPPFRRGEESTRRSLKK